MNSTDAKIVNSPSTKDERPYFVHRDWRRYMGQGHIIKPARRGRSNYTKFEAVIVLWNEYSNAFDVQRYAREFNWSESDVRQLINELDSDGVFDNLKPTAKEA